MRKLLVSLLASAAVLVGLNFSNPAQAVTWSTFNDGIKHQVIAHGTGQVTVDSWMTYLVDDGGAIWGAVYRVRIIDQGGVISASINVTAGRFLQGATIVRKENNAWEALDAPGDFLYGDTNDPLNYNWSNVREAVPVTSGQPMWQNANISIRWGDNVVQTYSVTSFFSSTNFICAGSFFGTCGEVERVIPV